MNEFFLHLIFPCANSFVVLFKNMMMNNIIIIIIKFKNMIRIYDKNIIIKFKNMMMGKQFKIKGDDQLWTSNAAPVGA